MPYFERRPGVGLPADPEEEKPATPGFSWRRMTIPCVLENALRPTLFVLVAWLAVTLLSRLVYGGAAVAAPVGHISGTTGRLFKIKKVRELAAGEVRKSISAPAGWKDDHRHCKLWAVSTTIWEPSKTLKQIAALDTWCIVVVLDKKTPVPFAVANAVVLTVEDQEKLPYRIVRRLPWNHFGRKNVGFLFAVAHGAEVVYDCDDDNELIVEGDPRKSIPLDIGGRCCPRPRAWISSTPTQPSATQGAGPAATPFATPLLPSLSLRTVRGGMGQWSPNPLISPPCSPPLSSLEVITLEGFKALHPPPRFAVAKVQDNQTSLFLSIETTGYLRGWGGAGWFG
eukprot:TRINITY_DN1793_c0_g1_i1.p1 TRINITY_DN1793_c0_g1~~TRINITY_DN1793_c0_g1_i1.p1  ORF type:complete len:352 (+),score=48.70 TRINITY_DN1793_c0_g1_i1:38-1057(+)